MWLIGFYLSRVGPGWAWWLLWPVIGLPWGVYVLWEASRCDERVGGSLLGGFLFMTRMGGPPAGFAVGLAGALIWYGVSSLIAWLL